MKPKTYVTFTECTPMGHERRKTRSWRVDGRGIGNVLGWIQWFGRWRQYAFSPNMLTVYSAGCLDEIALFCVRANQEHRAALKSRKNDLAFAARASALAQSGAKSLVNNLRGKR